MKVGRPEADMVFPVVEGQGRLERRQPQSLDHHVACAPALPLTSGCQQSLTSGCEQQGAVLPVQILHGSDSGVPRVAVVEIVQLLSFLPVPKT